MSREFHPDRPLAIDLLCVAEVTPAALFGLYEVLSSVGVAWRQFTGEKVQVRPTRLRIVAGDGRPFPSALGTPIAPHAGLAEATGADIVIACDIALDPACDPRGRWPKERDWLRARRAEGAMICSICTGAILLADAGFLDGGEATTHWSVADLFDRCFPQVALRPDRILSERPGNPPILTAGGASSWEDLALHLVARFCGKAEAIRLSKLFLIGDRRAGQLPYAAGNHPRPHADGPVARAERWLALNYTHANAVARMVEEAGLSERSFKRRFKAATGSAPVDRVQALRIAEARRLLEEQELSIDAVAQAVGYSDAGFFRRLFKRLTGLSPAQYRRQMQDVGAIPG